MALSDGWRYVVALDVALVEHLSMAFALGATLQVELNLGTDPYVMWTWDDAGHDHARHVIEPDPLDLYDGHDNVNHMYVSSCTCVKHNVSAASNGEATGHDVYRIHLYVEPDAMWVSWPNG